MKEWVPKHMLEEASLAYRTVWDVYMKFFTVFLTVNFLALAAAIQYIHQDSRLVIIVSFVVMNLTSAGTAVAVGYYSWWCADRYDEILRIVAAAEDLPPNLQEWASSPAPGWLGAWAGAANALACIVLAFCWGATAWIPLVTAAG